MKHKLQYIITIGFGISIFAFLIYVFLKVDLFALVASIVAFLTSGIYLLFKGREKTGKK